MLKSYLKTAIRHLFKNKGYSILNAGGLSVGLACFTLIALWVKGELSFDRFHANADRIYRVGGSFTDESGKFDQAVTPPPLGPALVSDFPEVESALRMDVMDATIQLDDKKIVENNILMTDAAFFKMFSFKLSHGDPNTALNDPYTIVITEKMAKKYFGEQSPVGHSLKIFRFDPDGLGKEFKITGVIENSPINSQFDYNFLISFKTMEAVSPGMSEADAWYWNGYYTYLMLKPGADPKSLEAKFPQMIEKYMGPQNREQKISYAYFLQPLTSIHLHSNLRYEIKATSSTTYVMIFGTVGIIVLLLACINYVNLSIAFSSDRLKEVGVRKVLGAIRKQLVFQYLTESWIMTIGSLAFAFVWIELSRSLFESLTGTTVVDLYEVKTIVTLIAIATVVGICSGLYPSFVLSLFQPVNILKGQLKSGSSGAWLRKSLVVVQYSITIVLVIGILVVQLQLNFIQNKDLGFDKENLVVLGVNGSREVMEGYEAFRNDLRSHTTIKGIARSNTSLSGGLGNSVAVIEDVNGNKVNSTIYRLRVDFDYLDVYKMKLIAGRFFSNDISSDSTVAFVVNETTAKAYGYQNTSGAVGKLFEFNGTKGEIIGVVKDFNYSSLQNKVEPTCMFLLGGGFSRISVRLSGNVNESLAVVTDAWKKHFPNSVLDYRFSEDGLNSQYQSEQRFSKVFLVFSGISLAIACLGLFALVSYTVESRTKEIGIRKVLGASISGILGMLSKEFIVLIVLSAVIAIPIGYYFMNQWLQDFAYRIDLHPAVFIVAGAIVLVIAWITISLRSISAAMANPVKSLKNE
jgi:putative ABC transport system permease protein